MKATRPEGTLVTDRDKQDPISHSLLREFMRPEFPLTKGHRQNRPAPAHIFNNLVALLFGHGRSLGQIKTLLLEENPTEEVPKLKEYGYGDQECKEIRQALQALLNADKRAYHYSFFSPLILSDSMAGRDPSDDQYAKGLLDYLDESQRREWRDGLKKLFDLGASSNAANRFAFWFLSNLDNDEGENEDQGYLSDVRLGTSPLMDAVHQMVFDRLTEFDPKSGADNLMFVRRLSCFLSFAVFLNMIYCGAYVDRLENGEIPERFASDGVAGVLGLPVVGDRPPGPTDSAAARLSRDCLSGAIKRCHNGMAAKFSEVISDDSLSLQQKLEERLTTNTEGRVTLHNYFKDSDVEADPKSVYDSMIKPSDLANAMRLLGTKIGATVSSRGNNPFRLVMEAPLLDAVVFFVAEDRDDFQDFVDACYLKLGLIMGRPSAMSSVVRDEISSVTREAIDIDRALSCSDPKAPGIGESIRTRLINCGLAHELSDFRTEMVVST